METWEELIPETIKDKYEIHNFNHAVEILYQAYPTEFQELLDALDNFTLSVEDVIVGGGNESSVPKKLSGKLHPKGWKEIKITGDLLVKLHQRSPSRTEEIMIRDFIAGHNIDYVKNKIAVDLEWNSKDQTFDRDLYALRSFYECGIISCGVIITRSEQMNAVFVRLNIMKKYGASTTWMGKLLPRLHAGRHGGCPLLVIGITPKLIDNLEDA